MKILKKLFLLCIPCMMFFSCESSEQRYVLSDVISKSEARKYYEDKLHGIITANDYKNGKYMVAALDGSSPGNSLLIGYDSLEGKLIDGTVVFPYIVTKFCPAIDASGLIYLQEKKFSFTLLEYLADDEKTPTGKYSFKMVAEENADVNNFITEDASLTGDILSLSDEKNIFDPLIKKIVDILKEQDIFNDKSAQPISKNIDGIACEIYWDSLVDDDFDYTTLQVDIPQFKYKEKNGSLYFYILQYSIKAIDKDGNKIEVMEPVTVEGAIIYGNKRKFIYKDYDGKLKD